MREGYRGGFVKGQEHGQSIYEAAKAAATKAWAKFKDRRALAVVDDTPPHRYKSPISRAVFSDVKHSLKLVGMARGYESVSRVAKMHNVGRSTAYAIKAAPNYGHYKGQQTKVPVKHTSRAYKVPVQSI